MPSGDSYLSPLEIPGAVYTIERELGAGGMATVISRTTFKHDRKVAIKVLRPELAAVRFLQKIKVTANPQRAK